MHWRSLVPLLKGTATYVPGLYSFFSRPQTGGTDSARYCYSVWLRHLVRAQTAGLPTDPGTVAELGPGDSLGIGLTALLTGAERYLALDVVDYGVNNRNLTLFDELVELLRARTPIPDDNEFPAVTPRLDDYAFPDTLLDEARLDAALAPERVQALRKDLASLGNPTSSEPRISYIVSWYDDQAAQPGTIDLIYSQAVLEHVDELPQTYAAMQLWLAPNGFLSHAIDYTSHSFVQPWNGHWAMSDLSWKLLRGKRPFLINREPHSTHRNLLAANGFKIVVEDIYSDHTGLGRAELPQRYRNLSDTDLISRGSFVQAVSEED